jgi:hypothetical protein
MENNIKAEDVIQNTTGMRINIKTNGPVKDKRHQSSVSY